MVWGALLKSASLSWLLLTILLILMCILRSHMVYYGRFWKTSTPKRRIFNNPMSPCHSLTYASYWFIQADVALLMLPARSPDCKPIENLRDILARRFYANQRQLDNVDDLKEAIAYEWVRIRWRLSKTSYCLSQNI